VILVLVTLKEFLPQNMVYFQLPVQMVGRESTDNQRTLIMHCNHILKSHASTHICVMKMLLHEWRE
jgi:hypothetical protein